MVANDPCIMQYIPLGKMKFGTFFFFGGGCSHIDSHDEVLWFGNTMNVWLWAFFVFVNLLHEN